jgi:hypothetical protein
MALGLRMIAAAAVGAFLTTFYFISPSSLTFLSGDQEITLAHVDGDELEERRVIVEAIQKAVARRDFAALERMASDFRTSKARTTSGVWKLAIFHQQLLVEVGPSKGCDKPSSNLSSDWLIRSPANPAAIVVRAAVIESDAWCLRGPGEADAVSRQAFQRFHAKADEAFRLLDDRKKEASVDPHFYAVMARIGIDQGFDKSDYRALLDEASARAPDYHYAYYEASRYYQPQWFGSLTEIEAMGRYAAERAGEYEQGMYARYYRYVFDCRCDFMERSVDWPTMKQSMRAVMARYPTDWNAATFARISCAMKDGEEAGKWFDRVKGDVIDAWANPSEMLQCKTSAGRTSRSTERCPQAAREAWSVEDMDRFCRPEQQEACLKDPVCGPKLTRALQSS